MSIDRSAASGPTAVPGGPGVIRVTYRKSAIGYAKDQKLTLAALGLKKMQQTVEHQPNRAICGMIHKVRHLVAVDGVPADTPAGIRVVAEHVAEGAVGAGGGTDETA